MNGAWRARWEQFWWLPIAVLYLAAENTYLLPDVYDNVVYLRGAQALAQTGAFAFGGWPVWDWPPGFSAALAVPWMLGTEPVLSGKVIVLACVLGALLCTHRVLAAEGVGDLRVVVTAFAIAPYAFLHGTRIMADWPMVAVAYGFLLLLPRLRGAHAWRTAVGLGLLLGYAALVRHVGMVLGVALVVEGWRAGQGRDAFARVREAAPAALASVLGASPYVIWKLSLLPAVQAGAAWSQYQQGSGFLFHPELFRWSRLVLEVVLHGESLGSRVGLPELAVSLLGLLVVGVVVIGLTRHVRAHGVSPALAVALANLLFILCLEWKGPRYLLVSAPHVLVGFVVGTRILWRALLGRVSLLLPLAGVGRATTIAWLSGFALIDAVFVVYGNGSTYAALSPLLSRSEASFYLGEWRDLYGVCAAVRDSGRAGSVAWFERYDIKYPAHWCEQAIVQTKDVAPGASFWPTICGRRQPFAPGTGLALEDVAGRAAPLETALPRGVQSADCSHLAFAVLPAGNPLPRGGPRVTATQHFGRYDLVTLSP